MNEEASTQSNGNLRRKLRTRHLTMIAIGGSIGTGLFVASGASDAGVARDRSSDRSRANPLARLGSRVTFAVHHACFLNLGSPMPGK